MKDPDTLVDAINEKCHTDEEREAALELASKWFEYSEYLTVVIDTKKETCTVLERTT